MQRGGRILVASVSCSLLAWLMMGLGYVFVFTLIGLPIGILLFIGSLAVHLASVLVPIVSAMGPEEEPDNVFRRSYELAIVDLPQTIVSYILFFVPTIGIGIVPFLLGIKSPFIQLLLRWTVQDLV